MKKTLLMLVALLATATMFADADAGWSEPKKFSPVTNSEDLAGLHTVVSADGSVYASSTIDQQLTFGESVIDTEKLSSCIVKYDKDGNEKWAVLFEGKNLINAMTVDADGNLYVTGYMTGNSVKFQGTSGDPVIIENPTEEDSWSGDVVISAYTAYVAKLSPDGVLKNVKQVINYVDPEIAGSEVGFYYPVETISIVPKKIQVSDGKVYVAVKYMGNVDDFGWKGAYENMDGLIVDIVSYGVFSLDVENLDSPKGVANVQAKLAEGERMVTKLYAPDDLNFIVNNGICYIAFFGSGELTLTTPAGVKNIDDLQYSSDDGIEHALMLAMFYDGGLFVKEFHAAPINNESLDLFTLVDGEIVNNKVFLFGSFFGNFQLDNDITKDAKTAFIASGNISTGSFESKIIEETDIVPTSMIVTSEEIHLSTQNKNYTYNTDNLEFKGSEEKGYNDASISNDTYVSLVYTEGADVCVSEIHMSPSAVTEVKAASAVGTKFYSIDGMEIAAPQKGLNIVKTADGVIKIAK